jgi:hypothetical protein
LRGGVGGGGLLQASQRTFETAPYAQRKLDISDDAIPLTSDYLIREAKRAVSRFGEPGVPFAIPLQIMERAIQHDDQLGGMTAEVGDEATHRQLASEMQALSLAKGAQPDPEPTLPDRGLVA